MQRFVLHTKEAKINCLNTIKGILREHNQEVIIREYKKDLTGEQRNWFHHLCGIISKETGYTPGEVKEGVKRLALGSRIVTLGKREMIVTESSEAQDRGTYSLLIEKTYEVAAEAGITLPLAESNHA